MREISYPFAQALDFHPGRLEEIGLLVVHATATSEGSGVAEAIQRTWTTDDGRLGSAHLIFDDDSTCRSVHDWDTAWHAKGANRRGLGGEIVGQIGQSPAQWADTFSTRTLARAAQGFGEWAFLHDIPVRWLSVAQLQDGVSKGFTDHATVEEAFPSTGHTDPGPNFPFTSWLRQVAAIKASLMGASTVHAATTAGPIPLEDDMPVIAITESRKHWLTDLFTEKVPLTGTNEAMLLKAGVRKVAASDAYMATLRTRFA